MENEKNVFTKVQAPEESDQVNLNEVKLQRTWVFWENYQFQQTQDSTDWNKKINKIFKFSDIISFWQFWNHYKGSDPKEVFFDGERFI